MGWGTVPDTQNKPSWDENLTKGSIENKWKAFRPLNVSPNDPLMTLRHWITTKNGKQYPVSCPAFDIKTQTVTSNPGICAVHDLNLTPDNGIYSQYRFYGYFIDRELQSQGHKNPVVVLGLPSTVANKIKELMPIIGGFDPGDPQNGVDIWLSYDGSKAGSDKYSIQNGNNTPLTEVEKALIPELPHLETLYFPNTNEDIKEGLVRNGYYENSTEGQDIENPQAPSPTPLNQGPPTPNAQPPAANTPPVQPNTPAPAPAHPAPVNTAPPQAQPAPANNMVAPNPPNAAPVQTAPQTQPASTQPAPVNTAPPAQGPPTGPPPGIQQPAQPSGLPQAQPVNTAPPQTQPAPVQSSLPSGPPPQTQPATNAGPQAPTAPNIGQNAAPPITPGGIGPQVPTTAPTAATPPPPQAQPVAQQPASAAPEATGSCTNFSHFGNYVGGMDCVPCAKRDECVTAQAAK